MGNFGHREVRAQCQHQGRNRSREPEVQQEECLKIPMMRGSRGQFLQIQAALFLKNVAPLLINLKNRQKKLMQSSSRWNKN